MRRDSDCGSNFVCHEESCRRIENPVTAFYATDGLFTPGRVVLDTDGDGRANVTRFPNTLAPTSPRRVHLRLRLLSR